jgi:hypothetical protein
LPLPLLETTLDQTSATLAAEQGEVEKAKRAKLVAKAGGASNAEIAAAFAAKTATKPSKLKSSRGQDDSQPKQAFTKSAQVRFSFYPFSANTECQ